MFQYAFWKALAQKHNTTLELDVSAYKTYTLHKYCLGIFDIRDAKETTNIPCYEKLHSKISIINKIFIAIKIVLRKINPKHYFETRFSFIPSFLDIKDWYIEGYFQSEKYFKDIEKIIRKDFNIIIPAAWKNIDMMKKIQESNSIGIHIRRGDFINNQNHGLCSLEYYKRAVKHMEENVSNPVFFYFSDDIEWVKENLWNTWTQSYFVDFNNADTNYEDLRLMSLCKHNITANSSFSWWWAWLNNNKEKIVIVPEKWSLADNEDRIPFSWIKM